MTFKHVIKILKELIETCINKTSNGVKCPVIKSIKDDYEKETGIVRTQTCLYHGAMNESSGIKIADAYEELEHAPHDLLTKAAYDQLAKEVMQQFNFLNDKEKITFEPFEGDGEPYKTVLRCSKIFIIIIFISSKLSLDLVKQNIRIKIKCWKNRDRV